MKKFTITITGEMPDEITDDQLAEVAAAAEVQVIEPQLENPDDSWNPLEFKTANVTTAVAVDSFVRTFLDLSTAHLPKAVMDQLSDDPPSTTIYTNPDYGLFVHVYGEEDEGFPDWYPPELEAVVMYARTLNVDYVLFDRDGDTNAHLPTWDW